MNTVVAPADDLAEMQDVLFALRATRDQARAARPAPLIDPVQRSHLVADSRARAWIPVQLIDSLR